MERYLILDQETDQALSAICDSALKNHGMQVYGHVNKIVASIREKMEAEKPSAEGPKKIDELLSDKGE